MAHHDLRLGRGAFVRGIFVLPGLAGLASMAAFADEGKAPQSAMQYQSKPNGDKQCSQCKFFMPGQTPDATGSCKVVDGAIAPTGYCIAYNPK